MLEFRDVALLGAWVFILCAVIITSTSRIVRAIESKK